ncbi:hypothetical protein ACP70R_019123 [Stipagrostis hirtigluma subsp. patula]
MGNSCVTGRAMGNTYVTDPCCLFEELFYGPWRAPALLGNTDDPAFKWKIYDFSALLETGYIPTYSASFNCCGYNWFLKMIPMHKKSDDGTPYVALCLVLNLKSFKLGDDMNALFEFSMYNHSSGTYRGSKASYNFNIKKTCSDKKCLMPLQELLKSSDFMKNDRCVFGVRILKADVSSPEMKPVAVVPEKSMIVQNLFLQNKEFAEGTHTWIIKNFLDLKLPVTSPAFEVGGYIWYIHLHPHGGEYSKKSSLSLYLYLHGPSVLALEPEMTIELTFSILDLKHGKHCTCTIASRLEEDVCVGLATSFHAPRPWATLWDQIAL